METKRNKNWYFIMKILCQQEMAMRLAASEELWDAGMQKEHIKCSYKLILDTRHTAPAIKRTG